MHGAILRRHEIAELRTAQAERKYRIHTSRAHCCRDDVFCSYQLKKHSPFCTVILLQRAFDWRPNRSPISSLHHEGAPTVHRHTESCCKLIVQQQSLPHLKVRVTFTRRCRPFFPEYSSTVHSFGLRSNVLGQLSVDVDIHGYCSCAAPG